MNQWKEEKVSKLIDPVAKTWKEGVIRNLFSYEEATVILQIPLSRLGNCDKQIWGFTKHGIFTVRSAYHLGMERKRRTRGEVSKVEKSVAVWKQMWRLEVPAVVKIFLWKALNNILPTNSNLFKKKIGDCPLCTICGSSEESVLHILWSCPSAADVWAESNSPVKKWANEGVDFMSLWIKMINELKKEEIEWMAVVMRRIWLRRNRFIFENKFYSPKQVILMARECLEDYKIAHMSIIGCRGGGGSHGAQKKWKNPGTNMIKANRDAAMDLENKRMRMRIVFRDEEGEVLVSVCDVKQNVHDPTLAESLALWRALEISFELSFSFSELMFEGDATDIIQRINKVGEDQSWMGHIINDIK
ncbi:hypothetical protein F2P56_007529 [Juglans regia]|uniref:Uncharacterized protein n=2 Tax=Juglans regia TaxID=51240 RepID=A0A833Y230_JUGRE|nr:uncharacterized protein LOC108982986 [Juglans regia]KAF5475754.1 hypothetical protein F2P56_007529 [Juglans regia]